ncbi:MAG: glycosyltransferase family 2 protein [Candidatus Bathyarchaeia archaeon]|jgi:GT2 family glycosyltransferase
MRNANRERPMVSIITVSMNGKKWLKGLFNSIIASNYPEDKLEIIFVDNGSTDGSVEIVRSIFGDDSKRITIIKNTRNLGWSPANNQGMNLAQGKIIVCISNDMVVDRDWIKEIVNIMEADDNVGMVQCNSLSMWDRETPDSGMNYLDRFGYSYSYASSKKNYEVFFAEGMAFAIKKEVIDKVGVFDDYFFMEYDDMDLSWRVRLCGYKVFFVPTAKVYHARGGTVGATYFQRINNVTWYTRNHLATLIKNYELKTLVKLSPIIMSVETIKIVYLATVKKNLKLSYAALKGILQVTRDLNIILRKRAEIQSFRTVSDKEILQVMHPFNPWLLRLFLVKQAKSERLVLHSTPPIKLRSN